MVVGAAVEGDAIVGSVEFVVAAVEVAAAAVVVVVVVVAVAVIAGAVVAVVDVVALDSNLGWGLVVQGQHPTCFLVGVPASFGPVLQHFLLNCKPFFQRQKEKMEKK